MNACPGTACPHYIGQMCVCLAPAEPRPAPAWAEVDMRSPERDNPVYAPDYVDPFDSKGAVHE